MESIVFGLGTAFIVIMSIGILVIIKCLRGISLALQDHKEQLYDGALGVCMRLELVNGNIVEIAKHINEKIGKSPE